MTRRERLVIVLVVGITGMVVFLQVNRPEPLTWRHMFNRTGSQPYDVSVLQKYLHNVRGQELNNIDSSFYELQSLQQDPTTSSWIAVTNRLQMDSLSTSALLSYIRKGGTAFIAATELDEELTDELGLEVSDDVTITIVRSTDTVARLPFERIVEYDTAHSTVVAAVDDTSVVCIQQSLGQGTLIFCSAPLHLTNYALLHSQLQIPTWTIINTIPRGRLAFDERYVPYHVERIGLLSNVFADPALRWAYWLCALAALLGVVVYGRRRQRVIPVIEPLKNASKEFALTVSSLYFNTRNNADLVHKLERLYVDHCRTHRGIEPELQQTISSTFERLRERPTVNDAELASLHQHLTTLFATGRT